MKNKLQPLGNIQVLQELSDNLRRAIIQNLGKENCSLPGELENLPGECKDVLRDIFTEASTNPISIPVIRYELETYTNDLNPDFSERFLDENTAKIVRVLDIGAGPGDVTMRMYDTLSMAGVLPKITVLERSLRFQNQLKNTLKNVGLDSQEVDILSSEIRNISDLVKGNFDLIVGNYVLDRFPQKKLTSDILSRGDVSLQFINCIPLQYQNPDTGQLYIPQSEIVIPEGAVNLSALGQELDMRDVEEFYGQNTVTSLQDGEEVFDYAGIRGKI